MDKAVIVVLVYVDDLLIIGSSLVHIQKTKKDLKSKFKIKDLGELKYFLRIEFSRCEVSEMGLCGSKTAGTPLEFNHKLTFLEFDKKIRPENLTHDKLLEDRGAYQGLVFRYIKGTTGLVLLMPANGELNLVADCDSDWGSCVKMWVVLAQMNLDDSLLGFEKIPSLWMDEDK
ncbi:uncharacterized mitochondrial protein AtMg00810-like [Capsicum annuum]|uniref:uncharacterized mitochondrial protein AtMg00810-like n=1 Tax=Capsicum annuum TaxID=4072 RepID=UPI001FB12369|nr:uncharacterized mitochondrial protein AtMg00810-like [Capsicum annuum]